MTEAATLPNTAQTQIYEQDDVLVSNIRPYFKKIWFANQNGGCSNDVLVFRANEGVEPGFLYYVLADDKFFNYSMATSKGTKMPRGDKKTLMEYEVPDFDIDTQRKVAGLLGEIDEKIRINDEINKNLEQQAQALFKSWFIDFEPFNGSIPANWRTSTLSQVSEMSAGGDKPQIVSDNMTAECPYPIYSNGISNEGLYGYTDKAKIFDESVTVSARGTIGFVCLRHVPYVPIVRLVTLIPDKNKISAKYLYFWLQLLHIAGTGTTQQQLTVPYFQSTEILVPDSDTLAKFTDFADSAFSNIWANQAENDKLAALRDTLLPRLMSGNLDVSNLDI